MRSEAGVGIAEAGGSSDSAGNFYHSCRFAQNKTNFRGGLELGQSVCFSRLPSALTSGEADSYRSLRSSRCASSLMGSRTQSGPTRAKQSVLFLMKSLQHSEAEENPMPPQDLSVYLPIPFFCLARCVRLCGRSAPSFSLNIQRGKKANTLRLWHNS